MSTPKILVTRPSLAFTLHGTIAMAIEDMRDGGTRVRPHLAVPRESKEWEKHMPEYQRFKDAFEPICEWLAAEMKHLFPEDIAEIEMFAHLLPQDAVSAVDPSP
ncbi:hypothetical protein MPER_14723, partial [Moniliophthora perniciosa FA553]